MCWLAKEKSRITMVLVCLGLCYLNIRLGLAWLFVFVVWLALYKCNLQVNQWFCYTVTICKHKTSTQTFTKSLSDKLNFKRTQSHVQMKIFRFSGLIILYTYSWCGPWTGYFEMWVVTCKISSISIMCISIMLVLPSYQFLLWCTYSIEIATQPHTLCINVNN